MPNTSTHAAILSRSRPGTARGSRSFATAVVAATLLASCGGDDASERADTADTADAVEATATAERPAFGVVSPEVAATLATDPGVTVIDVRTPEEYSEGHLAGATLIDLSAPTFADDVAALDAAGNYLVYCRSDNRSGQAVALMQGLGFEHLWDMDGGIVAWSAAGLPLDV